jgi:hypothetical protein
VDDDHEPALRRPTAPEGEIDSKLALISRADAELGRCAARAMPGETHVALGPLVGMGSRRDEQRGDDGEQGCEAER